MTSPLKDPKTRTKVLVVDDDLELLDTAVAILSQDFDVVKAWSGTQALKLLAINEVTVVCTDYQMPDMNGVELLRQISSRYPDISAVLVTGFSEFVQQQKRPGDVFLLVVKPYQPSILVDAVKRAAQYSQMRRTFQGLAPAQSADKESPS
jgi:c-di-GMP phosphodiesterase